VIGVALEGLLARKVRAGLTGLAIVLGVAMMSGTFVLTDTISHAFDQIFVKSREGTDIVVSGKKVVEASTSRATVPETLLRRIRGVAGVGGAAGTITDNAKIIGKDGKAITTFGPPTIGYGLDFGSPDFNPLEIVQGRFPAGSGEVAIDKATADAEKFRVGDRVGVVTARPVRRFRLAAIVRYGDVDSLGGSTIAAFDLATAQQLFFKEGQFDSISVTAQSGVTPEELVEDVRPLLPAAVEAKTSEEQAEEDAEQASQGVAFLRYFLLAFGGIALFVGAFVIFNTLSITVAQRTREFATLRTLGATRRQVLLSIVGEALVIGVVAAVIGLFAGLALAKGLSALFGAIGLDLPQSGTVFKVRTVVVSVLVGVGIALAAGLFPALRATRVPPISAVREGAVLPPSRFAPFAPYFAGGMVGLALVLLLFGSFGPGLATAPRLVFVCLGCLLLFFGTALLSAGIVKPLASVLGWPAERLAGLAGEVARENSTRNPGRTAATSAALMVGLALVTFVAVLGQGLRSSVVGTIEDQVVADYVVGAAGGLETFPPAAGRSVAAAGAVEVASHVRGDAAKAAGSEERITGIDGATLTSVYRFDWEDGSDGVLRTLGDSGAVVTKAFASDNDLRVGSAFDVITPADEKFRFVVKGVYKAPPLGSLLGAVSIARTAFDARFERPKNQASYLNVEGDATAATTAELEDKLAAHPGVDLQTRAEYIDTQTQNIGLVLALVYVLLALSMIVSLFGMVNTLALSIVERTREIGMLRAVGMSRRQVRRMVRHESVITAMIGAALGLPLGLFLAAVVSRALQDEGIVFALPVISLVVFAVISVIAGVLAAILPARRASRHNVLEALQYE
jgi:putative ABC transport system permease protein